MCVCVCEGACRAVVSCETAGMGGDILMQTKVSGDVVSWGEESAGGRENFLMFAGMIVRVLFD